MEEQYNYTCPKCSFTEYEVDEMRATGGALAKIFDVQNRKFTIVSCKRCGYTELYRKTSGTLGNIFDFFTN